LGQKTPEFIQTTHFWLPQKYLTAFFIWGDLSNHSFIRQPEEIKRAKPPAQGQTTR
jgi:hypothetical protein